VTLGDARTGLDGIADEVAESQDLAAALPPPRLLGAFDPLLHGWQSRAEFVAPHAGVVTSNGMFRPVALVDGRVVATWGIPGGVVSITPLERIRARARTALVDDAADVLHFLGLPERTAVVN
jgi:hypothetical protein